MSSSSGASLPASLNGQVTEKLSRTNYVLWRTRMIPQLRGAGVFGYVDGTQPEPAKLLVTTDKEGKQTSTPNPLHPIWVREDQQVLGYLLGNLTKEVLLMVTTVTTAGTLWTTLAGMYSSQSVSRINNIRTSLINAQKGNLYVASYFATMHGYADDLAAAGKAILDDELISYVIHGLDADYQPLISALDARVSPVTLDELFAMLSKFDQRMVHFHGSSGGGFKSSANSASRDRGGSSRRGGFSRGRGGPVEAETAATPTPAIAASMLPPTTELAAVVATLAHALMLLAARYVASWGTQQKIAGTAMKRMTTPLKMMTRWRRLQMAPTASTPTGMSTAVPPTRSPTSSRR
ncbi:unnamed protein product [Triticum aestivum]|uniref:Retrotransposon Copia-like N-terminal domain-containing protein n=1 Tax=Triticum aestivum TaxID=4565 RepID=A0A7H4LP80_WHEAT|nr:unnamed protein product [Triticum aestivum]